MNVTTEDFQAQMQWLATNKHVISLEDAAEGRPGVAITFDDGFRDNLLNAAPVLHHLEFPATVFVVVDRIGKCLDDEADPDQGALMSWHDLKDAMSMGIQLGAHTMTHQRLSHLDEVEQAHEIMASRKQLQERLNIDVPAFAYPYGSYADYNEHSLHFVHEAGFRYAVSNRYGPNTGRSDRFNLRRIWIDATDDLETFKAKVDGRLDMLTLLDSPTGLRMRQWLNRYQH
jgi:peptidoglycan/xylan/chitin deacetylase (PgdA/CDA1 family)